MGLGLKILATGTVMCLMLIVMMATNQPPKEIKLWKLRIRLYTSLIMICASTVCAGMLVLVWAP